MRAKWIRAAGLVGASAFSVGAFAGVINYGMALYEDRTQVSNALPPSVITFIQASISAANSGELLTGDIRTPTSHADSLGLAGPTLLLGGGSETYTSIPAMAAGAYPAGTYSFRILTGTAAPATAKLTFSSYDFPTTIPYLTGTSYSSLQLAPAGVNRAITWTPFTNSSFATTTGYTFQVVGFTNTSHYVGALQGASSATGDTIPGAWLVSGHAYAFYLTYYCSSGTLNTGFGGATGGVSFLRRCYGTFKVKANPKTVSGIITLENIGYYASEPIHIEVLDSAGAVVESHDLNTDYQGYYAFDSALSGSHRIRFKGRHWLSNVTAPVNFNVGQDAVNISLKNGDIDGDNSVTVFDYGILSDYFDKSYLDADWGTVGSNGFRPADADIDNDFAVSVFDYGVISTNFDQSGI